MKLFERVLETVVPLRPRHREGYVDPATSFADELVHPPEPVPAAVVREDPGDSFVPKPAARDRNPRLAAPLVQTILTVPAGSVAEFCWRSRLTKKWSDWSTRAGPCTIRVPLTCDLVMFKTRPAGVEFEAPPEPEPPPARSIPRR